MRIQKTNKESVKASSRRVRRAVRAAEEQGAEGGSVDVSEEASDLLFEAEDVAQLVAEVTGEDVGVTADEDEVTFEVGDDSFTVTAEGDEELLASVRKPLRNKKTVRASRRVGKASRSTRR